MWVSGETWETSLCCPNLDQDLPLEQFQFTGSKSKHISVPLTFAEHEETECAGVKESRHFMMLINQSE